MTVSQTRRKKNPRRKQRGGDNNKWNSRTSQFQQALQKLFLSGKLFGTTKKVKF